MGLLFYAAEKKGVGQFLWDLHQELAPEYQGDFYQTIGTFSQKLRQPQSEPSIAVLLAGTQEDLLDILSIQNLLERTCIILILPDRNEDTISKGHTLFPRFLADVDGDFNWVIAVLKKMLSNNQDSTKKEL